MSRQPLWELPIRLAHAAAAVGLLTAFVFAQLARPDNTFFERHELVGWATGSAVVVLFAWRALASAHRTAASGGRLRVALIAVSTLLLVALVASGIAAEHGFETARRVHPALATATLIGVGLHAADATWRAVRARRTPHAQLTREHT